MQNPNPPKLATLKNSINPNTMYKQDPRVLERAFCSIRNFSKLPPNTHHSKLMLVHFQPIQPTSIANSAMAVVRQIDQEAIILYILMLNSTILKIS